MTLTKTPEQLAQEYLESSCNVGDFEVECAFHAGYKAAQGNSPEKLDSSNSSNNSNGWISVKERLPVFKLSNQNDDSGYTEDVLMRVVWGRVYVRSFEKSHGIISPSYGVDLKDVTHWMSLPKMPEKEK